MSDEGRLMGGRSPTSSSSMPGLDSQESSWIGLLSRPAMALVEKIRNRTLKSSLVTEESEFLSPLEDVQLGPPHLSYLQCEPRGAGALPWLSADSLREIGLQNGAEVDLSLCQQTHFGYLSSFRAVLGHVLLSSQEVKAPGGQSWSSRPWWDSFWGGKEGSERGQLSRGMLGENAGAGDHKEQPVNNGSPPAVQNAAADRQLSIRDPQNCSGTTIAAASPVNPEQDNGYSSLEEEHLSGVTSARAELPPQETDGMVEVVLAVPQCQNKTINFIMGGPCSEDEDSQSEESSDDDDDGFDSEGSSEMSDGTDDDDDGNEDEDNASEAELEAERLWRSLCHREDPYDPRNFTARLHTGVAAPCAIPVSTPPSSAHSSPSSSPPSSTDTWDDSASASEADEESIRLWDSFSSSSDPFNPLNFQAPIRTRESATARAGKTSAYRRLRQESPPEYRKEEAEHWLDSGFCDASARNCSSTKKVRFCDDVEEFFASCGEEEDRRGPWEELARDRCRFLRRCREVEESIAYCLQPQHRHRVYERLAAMRRAPQGVCLVAGLRLSPAPL